MSDTAGFFDVEPIVSDPLREDLVSMIRSRDAATPRHLQVELGPSDVSHPCMRRMAYGIMAAPGGNPSFDPLPAIIGTAVHSWLDTAAQHANEALGRERWLTETRVQVAPGLAGSCDLFDLDTGTVIDWKVVGTPRLQKYRKDPVRYLSHKAFNDEPVNASERHSQFNQSKTNESTPIRVYAPEPGIVR